MTIQPPGNNGPAGGPSDPRVRYEPPRPEDGAIDQAPPEGEVDLLLVDTAGKPLLIRLPRTEHDSLARAASSFASSTPNRLQYLLGIEDPSAYAARPFLLTHEYTSLLNNGIVEAGDWDCTYRFFSDLEPDDGGRIANQIEDAVASGRLEQAISRMRLSPEDAVKLGATDASLANHVDPREGMAKRIEVMLIEDSESGIALGASPFTAKHEWIHATNPYVFQYRQVARDAPLAEIYDAIYFNRTQSEAAAVLGELRTAEIFRLRRRGESIYSYRSQRIFKGHHEELGSALEEGGHEGLRRHIADSRPYLAYKVASLHLAILWKIGAVELPDWKMLMDGMGARRSSSGPILDGERLNKFFKEEYIGKLPAIAQNILWGMAGVSDSDRQIMTDLGRFFTGKLDDQEGFLRTRFDGAVSVIGEMLGDKMKAPSLRGVSEYELSLPALDRPTFSGGPLRPPASDESAVHEVMLAGKVAELLHAFDNSSDSYVVEHLDSFLTYARRADPESAARVYSRIIDLAERGRFTARQIWRIGISLHRYGYTDAGRWFMSSVTDGDHKKPQEFDLAAALDAGLEDEVLSLLERSDEAMALSIATQEAGGVDNPPRSPLWGHLLGDLWMSEVPLSDLFVARVEEAAWDFYRFNLDRCLKHIREFREKYAADLPEDALLDEVVARALRPGSGFEAEPYKKPAEELFGKSLSLHLNMQVMITRCLLSPHLFRVGLEMLEELPDSTEKLMRYREAVPRIPDDFTDDELLELAGSYERLLARSEAAFRAWGFRLSDIGYIKKIGEPPAPASGDFSDTYPYLQHRRSLARLFLSSKNPELKARGMQILADLSTGEGRVPSRFYDYEGLIGEGSRVSMVEFRQYLPAIWRVHAHLHPDAFHDIPDSSRGDVLTEAYELLSRLKPEGEYAAAKGNLLLVLAHLAACYNEREIFNRVSDGWDTGIVPEIERSLDKGEAAVAWNYREALQNIWKRTKALATLLFPIYRASMRGGEGLFESVSDVENDVWRGFYSSADILIALEYLSLPEVWSRIRSRKAAVNRLAKAAIDRYVVETGESLTTRDWKPIVLTLNKLPLEDEQKDDLFVHLIEQMTPEGSIRVSGGVFDYVITAGDTMLALAHLMGNDKTPRSEALLLERLSRIVGRVHFSRTSRQSLGVLAAAASVFGRLPGEIAASPETRARYRGISDDPHFVEGMRSLDLYRSEHVRPRHDHERLGREILDALEHRNIDRLDELAGAAAQAIADEVDGVILKTEIETKGFYKNVRYPFVHEFEDSGLIRTAFANWRQRVLEGDAKSAGILFRMWAIAANHDQADARRDFYFKATADPDLPLEIRRAAFAELAGTTDMSRFAIAAWEDLVEDGDTARESLLYDLYQPKMAVAKQASEASGLARDDSTPGKVDEWIEGKAPPISLPSNILVAIALLAPEDFSRRLVESYRRFVASKEGPSHLNTDADILIYACSRQKEDAENVIRVGAIDDTRDLLSILFETFAAMVLHSSGLLKDYGEAMPPFADIMASLDAAADLFPSYTKLDLEDDERFRNWVGRLFKIFGKIMPGQGIDEDVLKRFEEMHRLILAADEYVSIEGSEIPVQLDGRAPLTQLVATRLHSQLTPGEQQTLALRMKDASRGRATRLFGEAARVNKFVQFLSYWPDVPPEEQAELRDLQANVVKSDRDEVEQQIRSSLGYSEAAGFIIINMEPEPIGVGTIADVYRTNIMMPDKWVVPVVVKVITESKEAEFRKGIKNLKGLKGSLALYRSEIDGAEEAIDVIDMYIDMAEGELDLTNEFEYAKRFEEDGYANVRIPHYYEEYARPKVAVMRFLDGKGYSTEDPAHVDLAKGVLPPYVLHQIQRLRLVNIDPQPGNLLVLDGGVLGLLDHGQAVELTDDEAASITTLADAYASRDAPRIRGILEGMSDVVAGETYEAPSFERAISEMIAEDMPENISLFVARLTGLCRKNGRRMNIKYRKLIKGLAAMDAATTLAGPAPARKHGEKARPYDEAARSQLATSIRANDIGGALSAMRTVMRRILEHKIAIGWRGARRVLCEVVTDVKNRIGRSDIALLRYVAAETSRQSGMHMNIDNLFAGSYLDSTPADGADSKRRARPFSLGALGPHRLAQALPEGISPEAWALSQPTAEMGAAGMLLGGTPQTALATSASMATLLPTFTGLKL